MFALTTLVAFFWLANPNALAAPTLNPTNTTLSDTSTTTTATTSAAKTTHTVTVTQGNTLFNPRSQPANAGDVVEFHFFAGNHSIAQASFDRPCSPLVDVDADEPDAARGFYSGFQFASDGVREAPNVFQIEVVDASEPLWYYCPQNQGRHCQIGAVGVINENIAGPMSVEAFAEMAALTGRSVAPEVVRGGMVVGNPNNHGEFIGE